MMYLSRQRAATAFARHENPLTRSALTFTGNIALSYAEPIAYRDGRFLFVTDVGRNGRKDPSLTATFSATTAQHVGAVVSAWAVENGSDTVLFVPHGKVREYARGRGITPGSWGKSFDA